MAHLVLLVLLALATSSKATAAEGGTATAAADASSAADADLKRWPILSRSAFTSDECDAIIDLYVTKLERVRDERESESVSRINRFDVRKKLLDRGELDWILDRIAKRLPIGDSVGGRDVTSADDLKGYVDFTLLHEFNAGMHFGLHVDTTPNDGTHRTYNVNVMLSDPSSYAGGALQIGDSVVSDVRKGDLYMYPASVPHAVHELESGVRYTYVLALRVPPALVGTEEAERREAEYWSDAEARLESLASPPGRMGESEAKLHLLRAEFLVASGDRTDDEIDAAYCRSYKSTREAKEYASKFFEDGVRAVQMSENMELAAGEKFFVMAACIDPAHVEAGQIVELLEQSRSEGSKEGTEEPDL